MKIKVLKPEELKSEKRKKLRDFLVGLITGIIFFGLIGSRFFWWGIENVNAFTWFALGFGAVSFGFLAMWFENEFWHRLFENN